MKTIIFDFDGTLVNSNNLTISIFKESIIKNKIKLPKDFENNFKNKETKELIKELKISKLKLFKIYKKARKKYNKRIEEISYYKGIRQLLIDLKRKGFSLMILTTNSKKNVLKFLKQDKEFFDEIYGKSGIESKEKAIKKLVKKIKKKNQKISKEDIIYVGDEIKDIISAKKANIKCLAVTWGLNSKNALEEQYPNKIVENIEDFYDIFKINK